MRRLTLAALLLIGGALLGAACGDDDGPSPTHTATPTGGTATATPTPPPGSPTPSVTTTSTPAATGQPTPTPAGTTYTVQAGDTLYSIAQRFGTTVAAIAAANGISDPAQIAVGQVLVIPGGGSTPAPTAPATPGTGVAQVVRYGDRTRNAVAFTFDAGSDAGYTVMILDVLKANGLTVSFGITGAWAEKYPDLAQRIVSEGHTLINHSWDHPSFTGTSSSNTAITREERWDQLDRTEAIVQQLTGATTKPYFRPPFGDFDDSVNADVGARGYLYNIMWTVDSRGWLGIPAHEITQRCLDTAEPGAIYVFHVGSASQDGPALQSIIDGLRAAGYEMGDIASVLP